MPSACHIRPCNPAKISAAGAMDLDEDVYISCEKWDLFAAMFGKFWRGILPVRMSYPKKTKADYPVGSVYLIEWLHACRRVTSTEAEAAERTLKIHPKSTTQKTRTPPPPKVYAAANAPADTPSRSSSTPLPPPGPWRLLDNQRRRARNSPASVPTLEISGVGHHGSLQAGHRIVGNMGNFWGEPLLDFHEPRFQKLQLPPKCWCCFPTAKNSPLLAKVWNLDKISGKRLGCLLRERLERIAKPPISFGQTIWWGVLWLEMEKLKTCGV